MKTTIITDPGIDDLIAIQLYNKLSNSQETEIITTFGNVPEHLTFQNAKEFIAIANKNWSLSHGSSKPLSGKVEHPWPFYFHGKDGIWEVHNKTDLSKVKEKTLNASTKNITSLGPLTTLLEIYKKNYNTINKIVVMGGVFFEEGNETKYAETNIAFDPDAANQFFRKCSNKNVSVVPLNVTRKVFWDDEVVNTIPENNKINLWIKKILQTWNKKYSHEREEYFNLHDPLAVYLSFHPEKANWIKKGIEVKLKGNRRGQTVFSKTNPKCKIALELKNSKKISTDIFNILFKDL